MELVRKKILQDIWQSNSWDEPVNYVICSTWEKWRNELCLLESLKTPRCFKPSEFGTIISVQLYCMSDASMYGYGQCSHLRLKEEKGTVHILFVMRKAGMTPKMTVSIPRLELATATLSVDIGDILKNELEYGNNEDYWMDSKAVLGLVDLTWFSMLNHLELIFSQ